MALYHQWLWSGAYCFDHSYWCFLCYKGLGTFTTYNHSISEFLFSADWAPSDSAEGGGKVGAAIFIFGSVITCALALAIATPFSLATAIFMTEISPELGKRFVQPAVEIFVGIPSVVYGWIGLTILVPLIKNIFNLRFGFSVLAAGIVLAVMIFRPLPVWRQMHCAASPKATALLPMVLAQPVGRLLPRW